jgi:hypothetical protein
MAESYLQHAEHYFRIIAAAHQAQQQAQMGGPRPPSEADEDNDDDVDYGLSDRFASVAERLPPQPVYTAPNFQPPPQQGNFGGQQPQPYGERPRFNNNDRQERQNYNGGERWRHDRPQQDRPYQDRPYQDRPYQDRNAERPNHQGQPYQDRGNRGDQRRFRGDRPERGDGQTDGAPGDREPAELPAFITAPGPRPSLTEPEANSQGETPRDFAGEGGGFHLRSRRRRRGGPRAEGSPNDVPDADEVPAGE